MAHLQSLRIACLDPPRRAGRPPLARRSPGDDIVRLCVDRSAACGHRAPGRQEASEDTPRSPTHRRLTVVALTPRAVVDVPGLAGVDLGSLPCLALKLRQLREVERRMALEEKARAAYLHGAEERSRATLGRPLTQDELDRMVAKFPTD